jgi:preprotein translocase subunit SecD
MATFRDEQQVRTGWSRTRWLILAGVAIAIIAVVVLLLLYTGGGGGSSGGGGY